MNNETTLEVLALFKKGFPKYRWKLYFDYLLCKDTIMRVRCASTKELLPDGSLRFKEIPF